MSNEKSLRREKIIKRFQRKAQTPNAHIPNIDFGQLVGIPIFLLCVSNSRVVHTVYGERELVEIRLLEDADDLKAGEHFSWWLTQTVVQTKIRRFKPLNGKRLCVVCLGKKKGRKSSYFDYYIGTEEEGRVILEEAGG